MKNEEFSLTQQIFHFSLFSFHFFRTFELRSKVLKECGFAFSRSEKPKKVWFFAHLFVPLQLFYK